MVWSLTTDNSAISTPSLQHYFVTWYIIYFNIPKINYKLWGTDFQYSLAHWLAKPKDKSETRGCTSRSCARDFDLGSVARSLVSSNHWFQSDRNLYVSMVVNAGWRYPCFEDPRLGDRSSYTSERTKATDRGVAVGREWSPPSPYLRDFFFLENSFSENQ